MPRVPSTEKSPRGRARDPGIDARVLAVAARHLAARGYTALSLTAVAAEAGTTRQAVYRRWPDKAALTQAAVLASSDPDDDVPTANPFEDLVAELTRFAQGISRPGRLSLVGTMLQESTDSTVRQEYRARIVAPRRARIREILGQAKESGLIDDDADLQIAVTLATGSWYARALAGDDVPVDWARRTASLVWRAVGGQVGPAQ